MIYFRMFEEQYLIGNISPRDLVIVAGLEACVPVN
jgi:hypothetical protein